jgi:hypothetical protein
MQEVAASWWPMRALTAAILGFGFLLAADATEQNCVRPEQPPGTGNSMLTWRIPDDCPLTEEERQTAYRNPAAVDNYAYRRRRQH